MRPAIRVAHAGDLAEVAALDRACFGTAGWSETSWSDEFSRLALDRDILVADQGKLVGYLVLLVPPAADDPAELLRIAVDPAERRTGIGRQLLAAALHGVGLGGASGRAPCAGRVVLLEVADGNTAARDLYRQFGFEELSRRRGYYGRTDASGAGTAGEDAVIMRWQEEQ